jgi:alcohol dehydrogenase (cytochrome c)
MASTQRTLAVLILGVMAAWLTRPAVAAPNETADDPGNWASYNRTLGGDRFSPLDEITTTNVAHLKPVCTYTLPEVGSFQTGPLAIGGTLYFTTNEGSYAIDASRCTLKWHRRRHLAPAGGLAVNRGFAYLDGRLFRGTSDAHVIALDAATGRRLWDRVLDVHGPGVSVPMAPIAFEGKVYVGNAGGDQVGVTGHVYALDAHDGHVVWRFDVVPHSGPVRQSWTNPDLPVSGGAFWTSFTLDANRGILYVPAGNPAPDFDTLDRTGDDLYADSVIALDAKTGRILAYNQLVKHDAHDWDVDSAPTLVTTRSGLQIIASANKDGLLSILDRSGVGRASASAPEGGVPVIPLRSQTPTTTRQNVDVPLSRDFEIHFCPGIGGGTEWNGAAYSPLTDSLFVGAVDLCSRVQLTRKLVTPAPGMVWFGSQTNFADIPDPAARARGWLTAYDAENGRVRWRFAAPHPMLAGVTPTAGGVVFAADLGGELYALDQQGGRVLWRTGTGQSMGGGIVSYRVHGHQRLAVASGMKSIAWPGSAAKSRILIYGLR